MFLRESHELKCCFLDAEDQTFGHSPDIILLLCKIVGKYNLMQEEKEQRERARKRDKYQMKNG